MSYLQFKLMALSSFPSEWGKWEGYKETNHYLKYGYYEGKTNPNAPGTSNESLELDLWFAPERSPLKGNSRK